MHLSRKEEKMKKKRSHYYFIIRVAYDMSNIDRPRGVCCAGELYTSRILELVRGEYHCSSCNGIYHALCAKFIAKPTPDDHITAFTHV